MKSYLFIYFIAALALAHAHSVLQTPTPYNTNPTKTGPCGINGDPTQAMKSTAYATWTAGSTQTLSWHLIVGDGAGNVSGLVDPKGGTNFVVKMFEPFYTDPSQLKFYTYQFTVPEDLNCDESPTGYCTMQVKSATNWFSCTTIAILPKSCVGSSGGDCAPAPPPPQQCTATRNSLPFCSNVTSALIVGGSMADKNSEIVSTYNFNLNNPLVFSNGASSACQASYQQLICSLSAPSCNISNGGKLIDSAQACRAQCQQTMKDCGVVEAHVPLYPCDTYPLCPGEVDAVNENGGSSGSKGGMSGGGKAFLALFFIGIFAGAAFAFYTYNKQGHLMGYVFDKHAGKFVKKESNPHNYTAYVDRETN